MKTIFCKYLNNKKKVAVFTVAVLAVVILVVIGLQNRKSSMSTDVNDTLQQTFLVEKQDLKNSFSVTGTVESVEQTSVVSELSGVEVKEVYAVAGQEVKAGDLLCTLDSTALKQKLETEEKSVSTDTAKAKAEVNSAAKNLEEAKTTRDIQNERAAAEATAAAQKRDNCEAAKNSAAVALQQSQQSQSAKESEIAQIDQTLNGLAFSIADLEQQKQQLSAEAGDLTAVEIALAQAKEQQQSCTAQKQEAESRLEEIKAEVTTRQSEYDAKVTEAESTKETATKAAENQSDVARAQDTAVRTSEETLKSNELNASSAGNSSESTIAELKKQIEQAEVKAPFDGTITSVSVKKGDIFKSGEIAVIQNLDQLKITASVDQYDISKVKEGMKALISVDSTGQETVSGTVTFVSPVPKTETLSSTNSSTTQTSTGNSSYKVEITLDKRSEKLRAGMNVKTELITEQKEKCLAVPYDCISSENENEYFVTIVERDKNNEMIQKQVSVKKGLETDYYVEIISDEIKEGTEVLAAEEQMEVVTNGTE